MASHGVARVRCEERGVDELLAAVGRGDQEALAALYDVLSPSVFAALARVTGDHRRAEEATAAVFVEVWRRAPHFARGEGTARAWITALARRHLVDVAQAGDGSATRRALSS
ncbi:sigma factor [Iamia majanohamensis]|uniref:Sigma factor n=1 Tax=Iamia majanohamensis TaxID=467976 RepID=A0AAE9Y9H0_9ACTN|nr:sigma factor [Iamia majanohamensis]WCO68251.1 sigma factor [Iamia majanohamensis]